MTPFPDVRPSQEIELMRLLHGELPAERAWSLRLRIDREPALATAFRRLEERWNGLELPESAPAPPGFSRRVMAAVQGARALDRFSWSLAPTWVRAATAAALAAGLAVGAVGGALRGRSADEQMASNSSDPHLAQSLADSYWTEVEGEPAQPVTEPAGEARP
jgi:anti-sigma factor RsiW